MTHSEPIKAFPKRSPETAMLSAPFRYTHPPPPIPQRERERGRREGGRGAEGREGWREGKGESTGIAVCQPQHAPPLSPTCSHTHTHTHLLREVLCHSVPQSLLEVVMSLLQLDSHDVLQSGE